MGHQDSKSLSAPGDTGVTTFSNSIRLSGGQWLGVGIATALLIIFLPLLWKRAESLPFEPDQRMPHDLGNDYWLFERYARLSADHYNTLLVGDSVVWGEYVTAQETLSHYLNELIGQERCANLGLDGAHPLALAGLVEYYTGSISGKNVVLQCNPLWMSSPRADLQDDKVTEFNHPRLVPQFMTRIPSYKVDMSTRIGIVVEQHLPWSRWTTHLQQAYYERTDLPSWTLEHPYDNPLKPPARDLPALDNGRRHLPDPWYKSGISKQDYLRLVDVDKVQDFESRRHFFAAAAEAMRRILVEKARHKKRRKHGGGLTRQEASLEDLPVAVTRDPLETLAVHEMLDQLAEKSLRKAELVRLRYFLGCTIPEAAQILGIAPSTAEEDWTYAKAWLRRQLGHENDKRPLR
jgi:RNA polymerase sigma factor (TIGR02999 family)